MGRNKNKKKPKHHGAETETETGRHHKSQTSVANPGPSRHERDNKEKDDLQGLSLKLKRNPNSDRIIRTYKRLKQAFNNAPDISENFKKLSTVGLTSSQTVNGTTYLTEVPTGESEKVGLQTLKDKRRKEPASNKMHLPPTQEEEEANRVAKDEAYLNKYMQQLPHDNINDILHALTLWTRSAHDCSTKSRKVYEELDSVERAIERCESSLQKHYVFVKTDRDDSFRICDREPRHARPQRVSGSLKGPVRRRSDWSKLKQFRPWGSLAKLRLELMQEKDRSAKAEQKPMATNSSGDLPAPRKLRASCAAIGPQTEFNRTVSSVALLTPRAGPRAPVASQMRIQSWRQAKQPRSPGRTSIGTSTGNEIQSENAGNKRLFDGRKITNPLKPMKPARKVGIGSQSQPRIRFRLRWQHPAPGSKREPPAITVQMPSQFYERGILNASVNRTSPRVRYNPPIPPLLLSP